MQDVSGTRLDQQVAAFPEASNIRPTATREPLTSTILALHDRSFAHLVVCDGEMLAKDAVWNAATSVGLANIESTGLNKLTCCSFERIQNLPYLRTHRSIHLHFTTTNHHQRSTTHINAHQRTSLNLFTLHSTQYHQPPLPPFQPQQCVNAPTQSTAAATNIPAKKAASNANAPAQNTSPKWEAESAIIVRNEKSLRRRRRGEQRGMPRRLRGIVAGRGLGRGLGRGRGRGRVFGIVDFEVGGRGMFLG